ncbi:MAG: hypothetical protein R3B45_05410 [Bdellovibrionota bacterium]
MSKKLTARLPSKTMGWMRKKEAIGFFIQQGRSRNFRRKSEERAFFSRKTVSFYRYCEHENLQEYRDDLYKEWRSLEFLGQNLLSI